MTVSVPVALPRVVGVKVTVRVQAALAATTGAVRQVPPVTRNCGSFVYDLSWKVEPPVFVNVTVSGALVTPSAVGWNMSGVGETTAAAGLDGAGDGLGVGEGEGAAGAGKGAASGDPPAAVEPSLPPPPHAIRATADASEANRAARLLCMEES